MKIPGSRLRYAAIATIVFALISQYTAFLKFIGWQHFVSEWLLVLGFRNTVEVATCLLAVAITHRLGFSGAVRELGLTKPIGRGIAFAAIATLPMLITFALTSTVNPKMTFLTVGALCFIAPFAEEVLYRGFMFRQLYRRARLGFLVSALLPSFLFAVAHLYQSNDVTELLGIVAVTGIGSICFCWLFMKWSDNVWPLFGLHAGMNLWWQVFAVDETALGGWVANAARLATIVFAVLLTIYKDRIWKPLPSEVVDIERQPPEPTMGPRDLRVR